MKVLDVACGSGNLAIVAAQKGADVTGIDIADNLINAAQQRAADARLDIRFDVGDAEAMPYEDNTFDVVMTMFGAMFAPRPDVTASELIRVCKPGGTIAMANWTPEGHAGQMFKLVTKYLPPPDMPPPVLWGVPEKVKERFGDKVTDLKMTPVMADMTFDTARPRSSSIFANISARRRWRSRRFPRTNTRPIEATSNRCGHRTTSPLMERPTRKVSFWKCRR